MADNLRHFESVKLKIEAINAKFVIERPFYVKKFQIRNYCKLVEVIKVESASHVT